MTLQGRGADRCTVDHDHETKAIRGLLCSNCNRAIGLFDEDVEVIEHAIRYIEETRRVDRPALVILKGGKA
jgi:hypothetical protein